MLCFILSIATKASHDAVIRAVVVRLLSEMPRSYHSIVLLSNDTECKFSMEISRIVIPPLGYLEFLTPPLV